ncbi:hypothetical protein PoB_006920300 [Plakobranchus ocellatus]|uniref:Uncharacterized protein n=1 Tax=Plakobranchus ocellatus TaxID=259542 RepID=A0AAV4DF56_9GAST|nr:hypothetical protein PoB_006920300 [Plakobranchus ocellatus]
MLLAGWFNDASKTNSMFIPVVKSPWDHKEVQLFSVQTPGRETILPPTVAAPPICPKTTPGHVGTTRGQAMISLSLLL